ncbi:MAG: nucleotidyltransferase substrate binding protein [Candidatus Omnitrophota bacterium]
MTLERTKELFEDYKNAVKRLKEAVEEKSSLNSLAVDGTIQRFEFTFELAWKLAKSILDCNNIDAKWPRLVIKEAFRFGLTKDGHGWMDILDDRNRTSHVYDEKQALEIYDRIKTKHFEILEKFVGESADYINSVEK